MKACLITFRSITPVQRAEAILRRADMNCSIQRTPKWMEEQGCGYSLRVPLSQIYSALDLLRSQNVGFRRVYYLRENGTAEEMSV